MLNKAQLFFLILIGAVLSRCSPSNEIYKSDLIEIWKLTKNTFIHTSYLQTNDFGKVPCNGLVYINGNEAMVFDTPTTDTASSELIHWVETTYGVSIKTVFISHSHEDCLGGLQAFHKAGIPALAHEETIQLSKDSRKEIPTTSFTDQHRTPIGNAYVISLFLGQGHTVDNSVSYIEAEKVLFGGCLIKALNANEGYTGEANLPQWSTTVLNVKNRFTDVKYVVPGHGESGDVDLLEYTIKLFEKYTPTKK